MNIINTNNALDLIENSKGKMFSVVFIKKNGEKRLLNGRVGVTKGLTGKGMAYDARSKGLLPVYDMQAKGYRMVTVSTIQGLKINKEQYIVTNNLVEKENRSLWDIVTSFFKNS